MANELIAGIRNHPSYDESVHSALIQAIEKQCTPAQQKMIQNDPVVWDSLLRGMLYAMLTPVSLGLEDNEFSAKSKRLQQSDELVRKSLRFLSQRAQDTEVARVELRAA